MFRLYRTRLLNFLNNYYRQVFDQTRNNMGASRFLLGLALRVYLTGVMAGLETPVHFVETADCYADNNVGAVVNLLSRAPNAATLGLWSASKDVA